MSDLELDNQIAVLTDRAAIARARSDAARQAIVREIWATRAREATMARETIRLARVRRAA